MPGIFVTSLWRNPGEWQFDFKVNAPPSALRLPAPVAPGRADGLWHHTCFELFLRNDEGGYLEFNFSPSGQWAAYQFDGYRSGMRELQVTAPEVQSGTPEGIDNWWKTRMRRLGLDEESIEKMNPAREVPAHAPTYWLSATLEHPGLWRGTRCEAAISAVIEEADGTKSYWALAHAPGKPDFHHADAFALEF